MYARQFIFIFIFFASVIYLKGGERNSLCVTPQAKMLVMVQVCTHTRTLMKTEDISSPIYLCEHLIFILGFYVF